MATTTKYALQHLSFDFDSFGRLESTPSGEKIRDMKAVAWSDGELWLEATAYLADKAFLAQKTGKGSLVTVHGHASTLSVYASFLEGRGLDWSLFPSEKSERPTYLFRGHLLKRVDARRLARTTANRHISVVRQFYEWARDHHLLDPAAEPFRTQYATVYFTNRLGLGKSKTVETTDLAISAPRSHAPGVEGGLHPIKLAERNELIRIAEENQSKEFVLALKIGFFTGIRIQTILGLTLTALHNCFPSRELPGWHSIEVGGKSGIPTKKGAHYFPSFPPLLLNELLDYCKRPRRAIRQKKATKKVDRDLVFLNQSGNRLNSRSFSHQMTALRELACAQGLMLRQFRFHWSRATFGTAIVLMLMDAGFKTQDIIPKVMALLGHSNSGSTLRYIEFIENDQEMAEVATDYADYLGFPGASSK